VTRQSNAELSLRAKRITARALHSLSITEVVDVTFGNKSGSQVAFSGDGQVFDFVTFSWQPYHIQYDNSYEMLSLSHSRPYGSGVGDNGGPFLLQKEEFTISPFTANFPYRGPGVITSYVADPGPFPVQFSSESDMNSKGTTAIARCSPTNPMFDAATFIGELREGLPNIIGNNALKAKTKEALKASSDEYLNVEFGWLPLVSDMKKWAYAVKHSSKILKQYHRDSGRKIQRRYAYPSEDDSRFYQGNNYLNFYDNTFVPGNTLDSVTTETWFEGAFRYYVPEVSGGVGKLNGWIQDANHLYGVIPTPETIWNITPWTWMADWFGSTGDVLHNIGSFAEDGLVMQYGYMMRKSISTRKVSASCATGNSYYVRTESFKQRVEATPYGFGFNLDALSSTQTAILTALGLSKGGRPWKFHH
jgi:hypothetical protein